MFCLRAARKIGYDFDIFAKSRGYFFHLFDTDTLDIHVCGRTDSGIELNFVWFCQFYEIFENGTRIVEFFALHAFRRLFDGRFEPANPLYPIEELLTGYRTVGRLTHLNRCSHVGVLFFSADCAR